MIGLALVQRETVQEQIYLALRDKLMRGGFEPGQKLKVVQLAQALAPAPCRFAKP
jgi:DNA-binding GntR family transcriptional regulator